MVLKIIQTCALADPDKGCHKSRHEPKSKLHLKLFNFLKDINGNKMIVQIT